jgi:hypothetical protein
MRSLKYNFTLSCSVLLLLNLSMSAPAQGEKAETLVGHWTFEKGSELKDLMGNFADITLNGAQIDNGQLDVDLGSRRKSFPI